MLISNTAPLLPITIFDVGSLPFLLKEHLSYSQIATFSLASYPYSLKLLWSPIVDSLFIPSVGRRRSWIIPMQLLIGTLMLAISFNAEEYMNNVRTICLLTALHSYPSCIAVRAHLHHVCRVHYTCGPFRYTGSVTSQSSVLIC